MTVVVVERDGEIVLGGSVVVRQRWKEGATCSWRPENLMTFDPVKWVVQSSDVNILTVYHCTANLSYRTTLHHFLIGRTAQYDEYSYYVNNSLHKTCMLYQNSLHKIE